MTWYSTTNATEESVKERLPDGWYEANIYRTEVRESKNGNMMQRVEFKVYPRGKGERKVSDFYVDHPKALWKYGKLAKVLGASELFKNGEFDADAYTGEPVMLKLGAQEDNPEYNRVEDVAPARHASIEKAATRTEPEPIDPDDIPF